MPDSKVIDVEVVREQAREESSGPKRRPGGPPIHPLAALLLIAVDNLWTLPDFTVVGWAVTVPLCFLTVFLPSFLVQKLVCKDTTGRSIAYALLLGAVAAVPTSLTGTPVGLAILAWTGISRLVGRPLER